jgi:23S rRNA maturation-related 3'-5' exoribonuclease YhaM
MRTPDRYREFRAYQKAVNVIRSRSIIDSIQRLLKSKDTERALAIDELVVKSEKEAFTRVAEDLMTKLNRLQPDAWWPDHS